MGRDILERLKSGPVLVADGATGTMLQAAGLPPGMVLEQWNIDRPEKIKELHEAYLEAGSRIIVSNTFGGNRIKLGRAKRLEIFEEANRRGVEIALEAAAPFDAVVAADMGPTGELLDPLGPLTFDEAVEAYAEQARVLAEAGAAAIWIETMSDLNEACAAVEGAQKGGRVPVLCSLSFDSHGRTMMGVTPRKAAETLGSMGLAAIGANCGAGLEDAIGAVQAMAEALPGMPFIAKPNAGLPRLVDGRSVYDTTPAEMARYAPSFRDLGARIIGGCCGSTPAHIREIALALNS